MKKKEIWVKLIFFLIIFSLFSYNFINFNTNLIYKFKTNYKGENFLKSSDNEISIATPENKTYSGLMSGYYPATYGFENDEDGITPLGWEVSGGGGSCNVISSEGNHYKVMELYDISSNSIYSYQNFIGKNYGTVEFWWRINDANQELGINLWYGGTWVISIVMKNNEFIYWDSGWQSFGKSATSHTWYHLRIEFECTTGSYQGLAQYKWHVYIDGIYYGVYDFINNENQIDNLDFATNPVESNYKGYIDAVGYSWDPNYDIGDNLDEGLLLSFENTTSLDWVGYSLDGQANETIFGNFSIPIPYNGQHNIQVFGNDSFGTIYESEMRHFSINTTKYINIITPENKTYTESMNGYYPATYGFENDFDGSEPDDWDYGSPYVKNIFSEVIASQNGHNKVVHILDQNNTEGWPGIYQNFTPIQNYGTIEFWFQFNIISDVAYFQVRAPDNKILLNVLIDSGGNWTYLIGGSSYNVPNIPNAQFNIWYHIRIDFRCNGAPPYLGISNDRYIVTINGVSSGELQHRNSGYSSYKNFCIVCRPSSIAELWVDAIGYSWDPYYNIGDNLNEGLLLSFNRGFTPDWLGYSLDGLANKTIMGNTTLPLPTNGTHNIQVFGNDSLGTMHASNLRYFTLDLPPINIITPENKTYTDPMRGYYPATYGFENDEVGSNPAGWDTVENYNTIQVISELNDHKNIVEIDDRNSVSGFDGIYQYSLFPKSYGTIEFWVRFNETIGVYQFFSRDSISNVATLNLRVEGNKWKYRVSGISYDVPNVGTPQIDTWYHIRVDFRCFGAPPYLGISEDRYIATIDGISSGELQHANSGSTDYKYFHIGTNPGVIMKGWVDAIGFSWDPNYNIGDNLNEGLLLSFDNSTTLDWMGYSLDGLANKTILGDTTIPFLSNGSHSIQVFGNDSLGNIYESEIRYFSINVPPPSISVIRPSSNEFYSNIAPSFSLSITAFYQITTWYTLDGGGTNITFTGSSGTLNQTEWDGQGEGPITIRFYANDSFGRLNYAEITINKDITDPVITINSPLFGDQFTTMPPRFNISVDELNINAMWYTIDGELTIYNISEYSGYIDSIAWSSAPNGAITIRFHVRDKAGNIDYEDVIVQKSTPPYIPPDNSLIIIISVAIGALSIFIGVLLLLYIILSRNRKYEPYKFKEPKKPEIRVKAKYGYLLCPYCHNENRIKNNYCIYCGASLLEFKPDNM